MTQSAENDSVPLRLSTIPTILADSGGKTDCAATMLRREGLSLTRPRCASLSSLRKKRRGGSRVKKLKKMTKNALAVFAFLTVAALTSISFAQSSGTTSISVGTLGTSTGGFASVTSAGTSGQWGQAPAWSPTVGAAGQIPDSSVGNEAGDLYIIDTGSYPGDILVTLYVNNPAELAQAYTYLNLAIVVYEWDSTLNSGVGGWKPTPVAGKVGSDYDTYATLTNGYVSMALARSANGGKYSMGIDSASFYAISNSASSLSPKFFVDVRQA